jgi:hypothetical protein
MNSPEKILAQAVQKGLRCAARKIVIRVRDSCSEDEHEHV